VLASEPVPWFDDAGAGPRTAPVLWDTDLQAGASVRSSWGLAGSDAAPVQGRELPPIAMLSGAWVVETIRNS